MFRCCACSIPLRTDYALSARRGSPMTCPACGVEQYVARGSGVLYWIAFVVVCALLAWPADAIAEWVGIDTPTLWIASVLVAFGIERYLAYRDGRMRRWVYSPLRSGMMLAYLLFWTAAFVALAGVSYAGFPEGGTDGPVTRVEGTVEAIHRSACDRCLCLRLVGRPEVYELSAELYRRLFAGEPPDGLRIGSTVAIDVPSEDLRLPATADVPRRMIGLRSDGREVFSVAEAATVYGNGRRATILAGAVAGLVLGGLAWRQYRWMRRQRPKAST